MSKGSVKKVLAVGLAGATVLSTSPSVETKAYAEGVTNGQTSEASTAFSAITCTKEGVTSTMSLKNGSSSSSYWYYDESLSKLVMRDDAVVRFETSNKVKSIKVTIDYNSISKKIDGSKFIEIPVKRFKNGESVVVSYKLEDDTEVSLSLNDYLITRFPGIQGYCADGTAPELECTKAVRYVGATEETFDEDKIYNGGSISLFYSLKLSEGDDYSVLWNGKSLDGNLYVYNPGDNQLVVMLDCDTLKESGVLTVKVSDRLENTAKVEHKVNLDYDAPSMKLSLLDDYVVDGGTLYFNKDKVPTSKYSCEVNDKSGIKTIDTYINGEKVATKAFGDSETSFTGEGSFNKEGEYSFVVEDRLGNKKTYSLLDLTNRGGKVAYDSSKPTVSAKFNDSENIPTDWVKGEAKLQLSFNDDTKIKKVVSSINGEEWVGSYDSSNPVLDFDLSKYTGKLEFSCKAYDVVGNDVTFEKTFKIDNNAPVLSDVKIKGDVINDDGKLYAKDDVQIVGNVKDDESGLAGIEILRDGTKVGDKLPFTVSASGVYTVVATDNVGNVSKPIPVGDIVVDKGAPRITKSGGSTPDLVEDGVDWYKDIPEFKYSIIDSNLSVVSIKIDGVEVINQVNQDGNDYIVKAPNANGEHEITVHAEDKAGNSDDSSYKFMVDSTNPIIETCTIDIEGNNRSEAVYFKTNPSIHVVGSSGSEIKGFSLYNENGTFIDSNEDGDFTLSSDEYYVEVENVLGRKSDKTSLKSLLGLSSNKIVVDTEKPVIAYERPEGGLDGWYADDVKFSVGVSDLIGISEAKAVVNGVLVDSFNSDESRDTLTVRTKGIPINSDNSYDIYVYAEDFAGNTITYPDKIYLDKEGPVLDSCNILSEYSENENGVFFKDNPSLVLSASDIVGVKRYILVDENGKEVESQSGVFTLKTGSYTVKLEDNLGNVSEVGTLKDLLGLKSNLIVVDLVKPNIDCKRPDGDLNGWFSGNVEYVARVSDDVGISSAVMTINGTVVAESSMGNDFELRGNIGSVPSGEDGSYKVEIKTVDWAGNDNSWIDLVYKDDTAPVIDDFVINNPEYSEGSNMNGSGIYGFYLKGATSIDVHVSDGKISSGLDNVHYTLIPSSGDEIKGTSEIIGGVAKIVIPEGFKGYVKAYATDKVGNKGSEVNPDGIISENGNVHVNTSKLDISLPSTKNHDLSGNNLYNDDTNIGIDIGDTTSGIRKVEWGIGKDTKGTINVDNKGNISGDMSATVKSKDKNLVTLLSSSIKVSENKNNLKVWVKVTDRVGNTSENYKIISIDKTKPVIDVSYDLNNASNYYKNTRKATVKITEKNFKSNDVKFKGDVGSVGKWENVGDDTWETTVSFKEDGDYTWSVEYTDLAGNKADSYNSKKFTIDKTAPKLNVTFDGSSPQNGKYFKASRTATVVIKEKNFNPDLVTYSGKGKLSKWVSSGDTHMARVTFSEDGKYEFTIGVQDRAGNTTGKYSSGVFIIDKTSPTISIKGVQDGISYKKNISFTVSTGDTNIDSSRSKVELVGRSSGKIKLKGGFSESSGTFTLEGVSDSKEFDDLYTLQATIYDKAGNVTKKEVMFSINRYGSSYKFLQDHLLSNIVSKSEDVNITETSVDRLDLSKADVVVIRDGNEVSIDSKYVSTTESGGTTGPWVYKYGIDKGVFDKDGKYQVQVYSQSLDGTNNSSLAEEYAFMLDSTAPEVIISGISEGEVYREVSKKVAIEVRDLSGVDTIEAWLNDSKAELSEEDGIYYLSVDESPKSQKLTVKVTDRAGNTVSDEVDDFTVTTNIIISLLNSLWFKFGLGAIGAGVLVMLGLIFRKWGKSKKAELEVAQENAKLYRDSNNEDESK